MLAVLPSYHKVVHGSVPDGADPNDISLHVEISHSYIYTLTSLLSFKKILSVTEYNFSRPLHRSQISEVLSRVMQTEKIFQSHYGRISFALDELPTLVPSEFEAQAYGEVFKERISETICCVYEKTVLSELILQIQPKANITHIHTVFLKQVLHLPCGVYVLVNHQNLTIVVTEKPGQLLYFNSFEFRTAEDFLYFILLVCEELKTDRNLIPLALCGKIERQSKIYDLCYRYFRSIHFLKPESAFHFSKALAALQPHIYFTLLSANNYF